MKRIITSILVISLIYNSELFAQDKGEILSANSTFYNVQNTINQNLYTGSLNFDIPLISIPLKGSNKFDINLNYFSKPFNPSEVPNEVGLNWNLNDDYYIMTGANYDGFTNDERINDNVNNLNTFELDYNNPTMYNYYGGTSGQHYLTNYFFQRQSNPHKKYYFKIKDIKGYFVVDNYGIPVVYAGNHNVKVNLGNYGSRSFASIKQNGCNVGSSKITLTDDKGNVYTFGGDDNALETTYANSASTIYSSENSSVLYNGNIYISGWKISKISYNNGDIIEYFYKDVNKQNTYHDYCWTRSDIWTYDTAPPLPQLDVLKQNNMYVQRRKAVEQITGVITNDTYETAFDYFQYFSPSEIDVKKSILDKIKINDAYELKYSYMRSDNPEESSLIFLNNISLYNGSQKLNDVSMKYASLGTNNKRTFLNKVILNNGEEYIMDYYNTNNFPSYFELANTDLLGLYARNRTFSPNNNISETYKAKAYPEDFDIGLLKYVIVPNKGKNTFEYERGNYSEIFSADSGASPLLAVFNKVGTTNIPRIKKINWYDNKNTLLYKKYFDYAVAGISTGTLNSVRTAFRVNSTHRGYGIPHDGTYRQDNLTYNYVKEYDDKGSIVYTFTDNKTNANYSIAKGYHRGTGQWRVMSALSMFNYNISQDRSSERGQVVSKKIYDLNNNLLKEITNHYERKTLSSRLISECPSLDYWNNGAVVDNLLNPITNIYREFFYLSSQEVAEYFNGKKFEQKNKFIYDDSNYYNLKSQETTSPDGTIAKTNNFYASEKNNQKLINSNAVAVPLEVSVLKNGVLNSKTEIKYDNSNSLFPTSALIYNVENGTASSSTFDKYDSKGNLVQYTSNEGIPTTIIFGYHQTQPIAQIIGATYSQVMQAFGLDGNNPNNYTQLEIVKKSDLDIDDTTENTFVAELDIFKNKAELKDFKITTYAYDPLIGVKVMSPSTGVKEFYKYNNLNQLERIIDADKKIVKEYKYNHAPTIFYNDVKSKSFVRSNCGPGTLPESSFYTVPEGKHSSTISQADANQKAQNDIDANGQNYVNINGVCKPYVCTITPTYLADIYYSSFQETSFGHIKVILSFPITGYNGSTPNWSNGVFIGTLDSLCRPNSYKNFDVSSNGAGWSVSIGPAGDVTVRSTGGSSGPSATLYFEYDKN
ncbi:DUF5977 domain-containing protein [Chryseobacterium rhizoplanae]|uniref:DUF5977 domain-containing protein n=1 Tax=Chryseobacterium rhizoplanae TaxID=1609531 RepID=UPI001CE27F40|nr:DUF5977 domain-containing protein [Chryseobacterium rhizoplanae]UCA62033.1 DUF5977 domain-containing protein [Chryseobacterium rhizoplanae]